VRCEIDVPAHPQRIRIDDRDGLSSRAVAQAPTETDTVADIDPFAPAREDTGIRSNG
jgi:hypothetical protein